MDPIVNIGLSEFNDDTQYYLDQCTVRSNAIYMCTSVTGHYGTWDPSNWSLVPLTPGGGGGHGYFPQGWG